MPNASSLNDMLAEENLDRPTDKKTLDSDWRFRLGFVPDEQNVIYAILAGPRRLVGYVGNLTGRKVDFKTGEIYDVSPNGELTYCGQPVPNNRLTQHISENEEFLLHLREHFGWRWVRIPIFQGVRSLNIDRVAVRKTKHQGENLESQLLNTVVERYGLYDVILRPTYHAAVDTNRNITFKLVTYVRLRVIHAGIIYEKHADNFLELASKEISSVLSGSVLTLNYKAYQNRCTEEETKNRFSRKEMKELNERLKAIGLEATESLFDDPDLPLEVRERMQAAGLAEVDADKKRIEAAAAKDAAIEIATGQKEAEILVSQGKAQALENLRKAEAAGINVVREALTVAGIPEAKAVEILVNRDISFANANAVGSLKGTFVAGGGVGGLNLNINERHEQTQPTPPAPTTPASEGSNASNSSGPVADSQGPVSGAGPALAVPLAVPASAGNTQPQQRATPRGRRRNNRRPRT